MFVITSAPALPRSDFTEWWMLHQN